MPAVERDLGEKCLRRGTDSEEAIAPAMLARLALVGGERRQVSLVLELLAGVVRARMARDLARPVEHAHDGLREGVRLLHLAFHFLLSSDVAHDGYSWIEPRLSEALQRRVAAMCEHVWDLHGGAQDVPYAFRLLKRSFPEGKLLLGPTEYGLTCATFVIAVFRGAGIELVDVETWEPRSGDDIGFSALLKVLERHADKEHTDFVRTEAGCALFRPAEVAAATAMSPMPVSMQRADPAGKKVEETIMAAQPVVSPQLPNAT